MATIKPKCFVEDCMRDAFARRLCSKHYKLYVRRQWDWPPPLPSVKCAMETCNNIATTQRGLCVIHNDRIRHRLKRLQQMFESQSPLERAIERFWKQVNKASGLGRDGDCWEWTGRVNNKGYGQFWWFGTRWFVHRLAFKLVNGRIHRKLNILHSCDNPLCVNPSHLRQGTFKDNTADALRRGRMARGTRVGGARLDEVKVREIRQLLKQGQTYQVIAHKFNVTMSAIGAIKRQQSWAWVV